MNKSTFIKVVKQDIEALELNMPKHSLEKQHIKHILEESVSLKYDNFQPTVNNSCLVELKRKINETAGHTFAAYANFYMDDMDMAKDFSDKSESSFEELIAYVEELIAINDFKVKL